MLPLPPDPSQHCQLSGTYILHLIESYYIENALRLSCSSRVKCSLVQSQEAPSLLIWFVIVPPYLIEKMENKNPWTIKRIEMKTIRILEISVWLCRNNEETFNICFFIVMLQFSCCINIKGINMCWVLPILVESLLRCWEKRKLYCKCATVVALYG